MKIELTAPEARVIASLIEKQITTPDQYPLSLHALVAACNQRSNREPVMSLSDAQVQATVDALTSRHLVVERSGFGSRVPKYQHRLCNTEAGSLRLDPQELAVITELLLRGPQTPGELRSRASRMAAFSDVSEVEAALSRLDGHEGGRGPMVVRLPREPGRRESRYAHLLSGEVDVPAAPPGAPYVPETPFAGVATPETTFPAQRHEARIAALEEAVHALRSELAALKSRLGE